MRLLAVSLAGLVLAPLALAASANGRVVSTHGVKVSVPSGWQAIVPAAAGHVTDPRTLLVVGTAGVAPRASRCQIAAYRIPPSGAVVVVVGWTKLADSGAQPLKPGRRPLMRLVAVRRPTFECFAGRGAVATLILGEKAYQVNVLVGDSASRQLVADALAVARSFDLAR